MKIKKKKKKILLTPNKCHCVSNAYSDMLNSKNTIVKCIYKGKKYGKGRYDKTAVKLQFGCKLCAYSTCYLKT